jgi:butyryl-CoA dehydrogenase
MAMYELTEQQRMIRETVRRLAEKHFRPKAAEVDRSRRPPVEHIKLLAEQGLIGLFLSEEYGGPGLTLLDIVLVVEEVARCCGNTAMLVGCTEGAAARALYYLGNERQKREYLPKLRRGELIFGFGMSEPNAGSDIGNIQCRAAPDGDQYVINGSKLWCTAAQVADLFVVIVRLDPAPGLKGVGIILVPRGTPGFTIGKHIDLMGFRGTGMAELVFDNCRVPAENLMLPAGRMRELLSVFNADRIATNPPICLGIAQAAFEAAVKYTQERVQSGRPIAQNQGIQWRLADMAIDLEAARALLYRAAARAEAGTALAIDASITKVFTNEASRRVADQALQLFGAYGLSEEFPMERMLRDVRTMSIGYGTTEIQRNTIAHEILSGRYPG